MTSNFDAIIVGAGGGGAVIAKELGEQGLKVLVLEAGAWYGNKKWPYPNQERGAKSSSNPDDLDVGLLKKYYTKYENDMNDVVSGKLRWGPADRRRPPWARDLPQNGFVWQASGVGGTTQHYWANSPRAYPLAIDNVWPIPYSELIPYYEKVESTLPVYFAATTSKEELYYYGASKAGWSLLDKVNITSPGYRPQPNAILPPNENLMNPAYTLEQLSNMEGCTLAGHCVNGCPHGPTVDKIAKRSTNVSYIPLAMKTGNVTIQPNAFTTRILTDTDPKEGLRAVGVEYRDTWTGETQEVRANTVVMAAGALETPRLWLNSGLPHNSWVGRGLTNHYFDAVTGIFNEKELNSILGSPGVNSFVGNTSGARFDYPGLGCMLLFGLSPGLFSTLGSLSNAGYNFLHPHPPDEPWDAYGRVVGVPLKEMMMNYRRMLSLLIITADEPLPQNRVTVRPTLVDEYGPIPIVSYTPDKEAKNKRNQLAKIAADILKNAGAKEILRTDLPPGLFLHLESTMRMGYVVDTSCEAIQVKRLFIADNCVHYNAIGGANPTLTTQALAVRTAEKLVNKYFS
ncbi:MAG TPA: GMC family oxidoreductase [Bacillota bacterium]|nr:GMC family oxidoreductase [Bacillota bacterium]